MGNLTIITETDRRDADECRRQRRDNIDNLLEHIVVALRDDDTSFDGQWGNVGHLAGVEEALAQAAQQLGILSDETTPELMKHYGL